MVHVTSTTLSLAWEPPLNLGGRNDLSYSIAYQEDGTQDMIPVASAVKGTFATITGIICVITMKEGVIVSCMQLSGHFICMYVVNTIIDLAY